MSEVEEEKKSVFAATVFSLFFAGIGLAYLGHYKRFVAGLLSAFIIVFLVLLLNLICSGLPGFLWGRHVYNANRSYNSKHHGALR